MEEYTNYLAHHGVKGMKWGVRRYQNADGTLKGSRRKKRSLRGNLHRIAAANYGLNERTYRKLGNNTIANMNAAARKTQLQKAERADAAKNEKQDFKLSDKQKKALLIGASVVGAALIAKGSYGLIKDAKYRKGMQIVTKYATNSQTVFADGTKDFTKSTHYLRRNGSEIVRTKTLRQHPNGKGHSVYNNIREISAARKEAGSHTVQDTLYKYGKISPWTNNKAWDTSIKSMKDGKAYVLRLETAADRARRMR